MTLSAVPPAAVVRLWFSLDILKPEGIRRLLQSRNSWQNYMDLLLTCPEMVLVTLEARHWFHHAPINCNCARSVPCWDCCCSCHSVLLLACFSVIHYLIGTPHIFWAFILYFMFTEIRNLLSTNLHWSLLHYPLPHPLRRRRALSHWLFQHRLLIYLQLL